MSDNKKVYSFSVYTPQQNSKSWVEYALELPKCHVCGAPTKSFCTKAPAGGWGSIKCGRPICLDCKCDCQEPIL